MSGTVWIVGAGPGDPELLTLKAARLIAEAEVVLYDALVNDEVLEGISAECLFVGKRRGFRAFSQEEINRMLLDAALRRERVVRLKGGDPFVFGRGGEEALFLRAHGIRCEVVPGVSAALAAAAGSGIPLTHRGLSSSVSLCAGAPEEKIVFPETDTVVYYMGASSLSRIFAKAIRSGLSAEAPVALIHNASLPDEAVWVRSAGELRDGTPDFPSPLLVIVGEVVRLAPSLADLASSVRAGAGGGR